MATVEKPIRVRLTEYDGKPMIAFGVPGEFRPFQFQAMKAQRILNAIEDVGVDEFIVMLKKVAAG